VIILNGSKFSENGNEFDPETCSGFARRLKRQIKLFDKENNLIGVINRHGVLCCATRQENGRYWYSYADIKEVGNWKSYMDQVETIESLYTKRDATGAYFLQ